MTTSSGASALAEPGVTVMSCRLCHDPRSPSEALTCKCNPESHSTRDPRRGHSSPARAFRRKDYSLPPSNTNRLTYHPRVFISSFFSLAFAFTIRARAGSRIYSFFPRCVSASRSVSSVSPIFCFFFLITKQSKFVAQSGILAAIRFSWQVRRKSRLAGSRRRHPDGAIQGTKHGHDADMSSGYHVVRRSDEPPHLVDLPSVPERPKNQKGRVEREPPVIIGDPAVSLFCGVWAENCGAQSQCRDA